MTKSESDVTADHPVDEAHVLISSARVEGTSVYDESGKRLGSIHSVMIHKKTGQVAYATLSFGGFLGMGTKVHPIPWEKLSYDARLDGYRVRISREELANGPTLGLDEADRPTDHSYAERMYDYYNAPHYWGV